MGEESILSAARTLRAYDRWSETYDAEKPPHTILEEAPILELLAPVRGDRILDLACGTGRLTGRLATAGAQVEGADLSEGMLARARAKHPGLRFTRADLNEPLPFPDGAFTKVLCSLSMRHVEKIPAAFRELRRIVRPGGIFVFSAIHSGMDWSTYERKVASSVEINTEAVTFNYGREDFLRFSKDAGWEAGDVIEIKGDERIAPFLTETSFRSQLGKPYLLLFRLKAPLGMGRQ